MTNSTLESLLGSIQNQERFIQAVQDLETEESAAADPQENWNKLFQLLRDGQAIEELVAVSSENLQVNTLCTVLLAELAVAANGYPNAQKISNLFAQVSPLLSQGGLEQIQTALQSSKIELPHPQAP